MDYRDQDNNSEGLFGARNENSVLFSIDSLNALDNEASNNGGTGFGPSGEESGLIDISTLQRMSGSSSSDEGGDIAPVAMESMVFNQVVTKHEKRKTAIIIGVFVAVLLAAGLSIFFIIQNKQEEEAELKHQQEIAAEQSKKEAEALQKRIDELELAKQQAESDNKRRKAEQEEIDAELQRLRDAQANLAADPGEGSAAGGKKGGGKKGGGGAAKPGDGGADAAAAPAAPAKSGGGKASPEAVKAALQAVNTKAQKCGKNGSLAVSFSISGNKAKSVSATGGSFKGSATEKCILTVIEKHSWPDGAASGIKWNFKL